MRRHLLVLLLGALVALPASAQQRKSPAPGDADKLEAAAASIGRMKAALKQVLGRAEQARNERDVVKLNCVNEKLTQIKTLIKVAEQADIALHEAVATKDGGGTTEFSKIAIARTKVDGLRADSEQCVGQLAYMVDEKTTVEVEQPASMAARSSLNAEANLGVANRGTNPAELGRDLGAPPGSAPPSPPTFTPPPIVRQPAASPYR